MAPVILNRILYYYINTVTNLKNKKPCGKSNSIWYRMLTPWIKMSSGKPPCFRTNTVTIWFALQSGLWLRMTSFKWTQTNWNSYRRIISVSCFRCLTYLRIFSLGLWLRTNRTKIFYRTLLSFIWHIADVSMTHELFIHRDSIQVVFPASLPSSQHTPPLSFLSIIIKQFVFSDKRQTSAHHLSVFCERIHVIKALLMNLLLSNRCCSDLVIHKRFNEG